MPENPDLLTRISQLERGLRRTRLFASLALTGLLATWLVGAAPGASEGDDVIRARVVIVEDEEGRDRIVLGAPMPDGRQVVGMKILDPGGAEQFGLSLKADGAIGMGFDVQPGVGDPRNRERLNLGVTADGRGWIRYLDNRTRARMFLHLDGDDQPWLRFLEWTEDGDTITERLVGALGEETIVRER